MKNIIKILLLLFTFTASVNAQEVYNEVRKLAKENAADQKKTNEERSHALFKIDALDYMALKTREVMPDSSAIIIDTQAYALYEFIFIYNKARAKVKSSAAKNSIMNIFKEATLACPRFHDDDYELAHAYINDKRNTTQFSLDTDWVEAVAYVKNKGYSD